MADNKKDKKPVYIRCPRCELNYCLKKDKYCSVCKAEMEGDKDAFSDDLELELCPICKTNYIQPDEIMCATCLKERQENGDLAEDDEEWYAYANQDEADEYVSDEEETGDMASISEIDDDVLGGDLVDEDLDFDIDDIGGLDDDLDDMEDDEEETLEDEFEKVDIDDDDLDDDEDEDNQPMHYFEDEDDEK